MRAKGVANINEGIVRNLRNAADKWEQNHPIIGVGELRVHEALRDAARCIEETSAKVRRGISGEERLPWMNQKVLVSDGFIVVEAHYNGRGEWIHNGHCMETGGVHVTHWLLKPEPPMEKERDVGA